MESPLPTSTAPQTPVQVLTPEELSVTFEDISRAKFRIADGLSVTPCKLSHVMSKVTETNLYFKKEFEHRTGSFKERGARNALKLLSKEQRERGVIAASAGNHALGLAYHGKDLGIPVTLVMPKFAPLTKVENCRALGAQVLIEGAHFGEAMERAHALAKEHGYQYVNGYNDPAIIAGQGTIALEVLEQTPNLDAIIVPVGGAGLIAGVALAIKTLRPEVEVIGVETETCPSFTAALAEGKPIAVKVGSTIADGLAVPTVGNNAFAIARRHVDRVVLVKERHVAIAVLRLMELEKSIVEGAGATGLAALLSGQLDHLRGKNVVCLLCGGNIDVPVIGRIIERGLAADGRLSKFIVSVSDRPGSIAGLTALIAQVGASVKDIYHERAWLDSDVMSVQIKCVVETRSLDHSKELHQALLREGYSVVWGFELMESALASVRGKR